MGLGFAHFIPLIAYLGFWVMCILALSGRPLLGFYYVIPFLPYRTMRDHFLDYPLGSNVLTILVVAVIIGALIKGKSLPKTKLYMIWLVFAIYLYLSMWLGVAMGNGTPPLWLNDVNFVTWKDYMMIPLTFVAAGLVVEDRKAVKMVIVLTAFTLLAIDRSCLMDSMSRTWTTFDENKRNGGPLGLNSNETAAFLAQFGMFFWGLGQFLKKKYRIIAYGLSGITIFATMYTFSRGAYLAIIFSLFVLGLLKDRKLLIIGVAFLLTWQTIVPTAVRQRIQMTHSSNGKLESSANERVELWTAAEESIESSPIFGIGYAVFQTQDHVDGLKDTHNWYVKVLVETGIIGMIIVIYMIQQMLAVAYRVFKKAEDPLYKGLGLGLFISMCSCIIANCFGDRWTYLEITGMMWVLIATAARALQLSETAPATETVVAAAAPVSNNPNPFLAYR